MKKIIAMGLVLILVLCSCNKPMEYQSEFLSFEETTFEDLFNDSMLIAVATYAGEKVQVNPDSKDGKPVTDHTMKVERVIKGPDYEQFKFRMEYGVFKNVTYSTSLDIQMQEGDSYLLFLNRGSPMREDDAFAYRIFHPDGCVKLDADLKPQLSKTDSDYAKKIIDMCSGKLPEANTHIESDYFYYDFNENIGKADIIVTGSFTGEYTGDRESYDVDFPFIIDAVLKGEAEGEIIIRADAVSVGPNAIIYNDEPDSSKKYMLILSKSAAGDKYYAHHPGKFLINDDGTLNTSSDEKELYTKLFKDFLKNR